MKKRLLPLLGLTAICGMFGLVSCQNKGQLEPIEDVVNGDNQDYSARENPVVAESPNVFSKLSSWFSKVSSRGLSQEEARKLLRVHFALPKDEFTELKLEEIKATKKWIEYDRSSLYGLSRRGGLKEVLKDESYRKSEKLSRLERNGLITITTKRVDDPSYLWDRRTGGRAHSYTEYYVVGLSRNSKHFVKRDSVKVAVIEFGEITEIVENDKTNNVKVSFTTKRVGITPFGKALRIGEERLSHVVYFNKHDHGWHIVDAKQKRR